MGGSAVPNRVKGSHVVSSWNGVALYLAYCSTLKILFKKKKKKTTYQRAHYPWHTRNVSFLEPRTAFTCAYASNSDDTDSHPWSVRRKRTAPSPLVHTPVCPYAHRLLRVLDHPSSHSSTVSLHSAVSIPAKGPSYSSIPSTSTPPCRSIHSPDAAARGRSKHTETET